LTLAIGGCTVQELQNRMTASEFQDWKAFYLLEPFGSLRDDHRAGTIAAVVANVHKKKGTTSYKATDFFPPYQPRVQEWQDQLRIVEMLNQVFGGKDLRQKPVD